MKRICSQCLRKSDTEAMVQFGEEWVCAKCKPEYAQKLKEGMIADPPRHLWWFWQVLMTPVIGVVAWCFPILLYRGLNPPDPRVPMRGFLTFLILVLPSAFICTIIAIATFLYFANRKPKDKFAEPIPDSKNDDDE